MIAKLPKNMFTGDAGEDNSVGKGSRQMLKIQK